MNTQFNLFEGERLRDQGIMVAQASRPSLFEEACEVAKGLGREKRFVTADDVRERLESWGISVDLGNSWGGIFRSRHWQRTDRRVKSRYTRNHAREIKVWEFVG